MGKDIPRRGIPLQYPGAQLLLRQQAILLHPDTGIGRVVLAAYPVSRAVICSISFIYPTRFYVIQSCTSAAIRSRVR